MLRSVIYCFVTSQTLKTSLKVGDGQTSICILQPINHLNLYLHTTEFHTYLLLISQITKPLSPPVQCINNDTVATSHNPSFVATTVVAQSVPLSRLETYFSMIDRQYHLKIYCSDVDALIRQTNTIQVF